MKLHFLTIFLLFGCESMETNSMTTTPSPPKLERISFQSTATDLERDFYVYVPKGYDDHDSEWPVLLFLHGNGERGNGKDELDFVLAHGPVYEAWVQKRDLPFIIISPQLPMWGMDEVDYIRDRKKEDIPQRQAEGIPPRPSQFETDMLMTGNPSNDSIPFGPEGPPVGYMDMEDDLLTILQMVKDKYRTDPSRWYLTGLSYGGFGTWNFASAHPEMFAAINPIVGWGHPDVVAPLAENNVPIWVFAGGRDPVVRVEYFYPGINKLEALGHPVRFTTEEDMGHDVWTRVYAGEDIYQWLLSHSK